MSKVSFVEHSGPLQYAVLNNTAIGDDRVGPTQALQQTVKGELKEVAFWSPASVYSTPDLFYPVFDNHLPFSQGPVWSPRQVGGVGRHPARRLASGMPGAREPSCISWEAAASALQGPFLRLISGNCCLRSSTISLGDRDWCSLPSKPLGTTGLAPDAACKCVHLADLKCMALCCRHSHSLHWAVHILWVYGWYCSCSQGLQQHWGHPVPAGLLGAGGCYLICAG